MKKYTMTTLNDLRPGDSFYKDGDMNEIVYVVSDVKCTYHGMRYVRKGELKLADMLPGRQNVIFLKHKI